MRIPLNPSGGREIALICLLFGGSAAAAFLSAAMGTTWCWPVAILLTILCGAGLAFFRDPERMTPNESGILVAPADGKVVESVKLDRDERIGGPATRLSIFLSIFDVHVNRSPCAGVVRSMDYQPGRFLDARNPNAGSLNEANTIVIDPDEPDTGPVVVRQIAGLIARRIVCNVKVGDHVEAGQRIGLIKFGSRTELIVAGHDRYAPAVQVGDRAHGAITIMARRITLNPAAESAAAGTAEGRLT